MVVIPVTFFVGRRRAASPTALLKNRGQAHLTNPPLMREHKLYLGNSVAWRPLQPAPESPEHAAIAPVRLSAMFPASD